MTTYNHNRPFVRWGVAVILITLLYGTIYSVAQQVLRQSANDPQIQNAEDTVTALKDGHSLSEFGTTNILLMSDISHSLATFGIVYDANGKPISSTAQINGAIPVVPMDVLNTAAKEGRDVITWEPADDVRIALVVMPFEIVGKTAASSTNGYVAVGRSIREVEIREILIFKNVSLIWVLTILIISAIAWHARKKPEGAATM